MKIQDVKAVQVLDSRGNPTLRVSVQAEDEQGNFVVPSGASTGQFEAVELRDEKKAFNGQGVLKAIKNVEGPIKEALIGQESSNQKQVDEILINLDGTDNKSNLGANAILGVSGATTRLAARSLHLPLYAYLRVIFEQDGIWQPGLAISTDKYVLPKMFFNILNGGCHADNKLDIQETMIVPQKETIRENIQIACEVYQKLKEVLKGRSLSISLGDEGGFAPDLESNTKALDLVVEAINQAGYKPGRDITLALDVAASEIYDPEKDEKYILASENIGLSAMQLVSLYKELITNYPLISIEDGLAEEDWEGWQMMTERIGDKVQLVGDDLFVTNTSRIQKGIDQKVANSVLIKMNQVGTISETFSSLKLASRNGYKTMISHRSGETEDAYISDLAVATGAGQIKAGAPARGERIAKYNRLIEIEEELKR
jgi:enolase